MKNITEANLNNTNIILNYLENNFDIVGVPFAPLVTPILRPAVQ